MKKTVKEDLRNRSIPELKTTIETLQRDLFSIRLHAATKPLQDVGHYRKMKKNIARALTFLRQKQENA
ncbi:50S ribosomal protein L29 [Candidatus Dependentiae bacterium]|nr:50S ribosomal protein L29 [Candidatus Dependentiae bacterium]